MAKPWTSPPATGGKSSRQPCYNITKTTSTSLLPPPPSQMVTSSTPLHFNNKNNINNLSSTGSPAPLMSAATTRQSLDLFHQNAARYQLEPRSSLITGLLLCTAFKLYHHLTLLLLFFVYLFSLWFDVFQISLFRL